MVFRDITQQLKYEAEILKSKKLESIGVLAGGIAHDFNNVMVALFGNIELVLLALEKEHSARKHLSLALEAIERTRSLTNQFITFSKGGMPVIDTINLKNILKSVVMLNLTGSNVQPIYEIKDDLWMVKADKGQIAQVIANIVINAKEAMQNGGKLFIKAENVFSFRDNFET